MLNMLTASKRTWRPEPTAGVTGTPAIFVNGRPLLGTVPYQQITVFVDEELKSAGQ